MRKYFSLRLDGDMSEKGKVIDSTTREEKERQHQTLS